MSSDKELEIVKFDYERSLRLQKLQSKGSRTRVGDFVHIMRPLVVAKVDYHNKMTDYYGAVKNIYQDDVVEFLEKLGASNDESSVRSMLHSLAGAFAMNSSEIKDKKIYKYPVHELTNSMQRIKSVLLKKTGIYDSQIGYSYSNFDGEDYEPGYKSLIDQRSHKILILEIGYAIEDIDCCKVGYEHKYDHLRKQYHREVIAEDQTEIFTYESDDFNLPRKDYSVKHNSIWHR